MSFHSNTDTQSQPCLPVLFTAEFDCECNFFNKRGRGSFRGGDHILCQSPALCFQSQQKWWVCWDNEGGHYQRVKAFGDKPWLMTRKSEAALICTGPLAHRGKAVCYTKETPNLLRDMLNIPPLLGTEKSTPSLMSVLVMGAFQNSLQACILFRFWFLG